LERGVLEIVVGCVEEILVAFISARNALAAERHDENALEVNLLAERLVYRKEDVVDDQIAVSRVVRDEGKFAGMETKVQGVKNSAASRYAEISFEMR
jgi:hypothetical protein